MFSERPSWEKVLSSAATLQRIVPDAVMVGGSAAAIHASHRFSTDHAHVVPDLRERFDDILTSLESIAGWNTARVRRPVLILGSLDGIETGIRQLIRSEPLEIEYLDVDGTQLAVPTRDEILRIQGVLILRRNATRDYVDFVALAESLSVERVKLALSRFDTLYPQESGQSALQQLCAQLANPMPYDLEGDELSLYKGLVARWSDWSVVSEECGKIAVECFRPLSSD